MTVHATPADRAAQNESRGPQAVSELELRGRVLADIARGLTRSQAAEIARVDRTAAIPLSFAQQRLWFLEQLGNLGSTYHIRGIL